MNYRLFWILQAFSVFFISTAIVIGPTPPGTGIFPAACSAVEAVDTCAGKVVDAIKEMDGVALITADHGNADKMYEKDGSPFTAHTTNPVPFCVVNYPCTLREGGKLADIAPTMLKILGLPQPEEMTGTSIIE